MTPPPEDDITQLISLARDGASEVRERLYDAVYEELRTIARGLLSRRGPERTLGATALANEVFLRFETRFPAPPADVPESRRTFYRSVALAMRTVLRDHARAMGAAKRGGGWNGHMLDESIIAGDRTDPIEPGMVLLMDEAVSELERQYPRWAEVLMYRFYAGRTIDETSAMMGLSAASVSRDWALARAWLRDWFGAGTSEDAQEDASRD